MEPSKQAELEKQIHDLQHKFEKALDDGVQFSGLKKIWLDLKMMQEQWKSVIAKQD